MVCMFSVYFHLRVCVCARVSLLSISTKNITQYLRESECVDVFYSTTEFWELFGENKALFLFIISRSQVMDFSFLDVVASVQ